MEIKNFNFSRQTAADSAIELPLLQRQASAELGGDFTLPEDAPEAVRIIRSDAYVSSPVKAITSDGLRLGGGVEYRIVYLGADGQYHSTTFSGDYDLPIPIDSTDGMTPSVRMEVGPPVCRMKGSGRVSIRCKLFAALSAGKKHNGDGGNLPELPHIQRLTAKCPTASFVCGTNEDCHVSLPLSMPEDGRYLATDCRIHIDEVTAGEGFADCRGRIFAKHYVAGKDGLFAVTERLPFSDVVEVDGLVPGAPVCARAMITEMSPPMPSENGDEVTVGYALDATGFIKGELEYVKDAYSSEYTSEIAVESLTLPYLISCKNRNMTFSGQTDSSPEGQVNVIDVCGTGEVTSAEASDGRTVLHGTCRFCVIYSDENGDVSVGEWELPFKYEPDDPPGGEISRSDCGVTIIEPRCRAEKEGLRFDCEIALSVFCLGESTVERVADISLGRELDKGSGFTVCFPEKGESLWDVAKKYGAPLSETAKENGIPESAGFEEMPLPEDKKYMIV